VSCLFTFQPVYYVTVDRSGKIYFIGIGAFALLALLRMSNILTQCLHIPLAAGGASYTVVQIAESFIPVLIVILISYFLLRRVSKVSLQSVYTQRRLLLLSFLAFIVLAIVNRFVPMLYQSSVISSYLEQEVTYKSVSESAHLFGAIIKNSALVIQYVVIFIMLLRIAKTGDTA